MALNEINDLKALDAELATDNLRGLWAREETVRREPAPFGKPILWKWAKIRAGLEAAGRLITTNYKGARRAISLVHPNMSDSTTHTLNMAVQLVKAGEAVYSHRHTNAAMRFVIDGGENVYTITNGEKCMMRRGDLVIQPSWGWHNHINETDRDAIWIDGLDSGLMRSLRTMFQEPHPAEDLRLYNSPVETTARNPGLLAPPGQGLKSLVYKWDETRRALAEMLPDAESEFDGKCLEYRNPSTGGPTFPTFSCWIQQLDGGKQTGEHRHTSNQIYYAVEGSGVTDVEGEKLPWEAGDFFVIPNWSWHKHKNSSANIACCALFNDRPSPARSHRRLPRAEPVALSDFSMNQQERIYNLAEFAAAAPATANPGESLPAKVGAAAPEFQATTIDGTIMSLGDFRGQRHVVIMTGAVTSPMCAFEVPQFNRLHEEFDNKGVSFLLLYTRESHPAENYGAHTSFEQKLAYARDLQRLENVQFPIIVDHLDGRIHRAYGVWPNALFVVHKDGRLVFRSNMANHGELRQFLDDLMAAEQAAAAGHVLHLQYSERVMAHEADQDTHHRVYARAGQKAFEDYWTKRPQNRNRWP